MTTSHIVLPKLLGTNYFYWSKHMQPIFITKYLWELVINGYAMPFADEFKALSDDDKKSLKELIKKDNEALSLIGSAIEESIFLRISVLESSKQAWDILKNTYECVVVAKLQTLRQKFENANMQSNESIHDYITKMKDLVNQMRSLGEDVPERRLIEKILRSVLPKFQMVTTNVMVFKDLNTMKIDELSRFLLNVEESNPTEETNHAFSTRHKGRGRSKSQYQNKKQNRHPQQSQNYQGNASTSRGRGRGISPSQFRGRSREGFRGRGRGRDGPRERQGPKCYYCHKFGHLEKYCYAQLQDMKHKDANRIVEKTRNEKLFISSFMTHNEESEAWYIDLGCSTHMTSQEELFTRINDNYFGEVIFGDERVFEVKGKGTVAIPTLHGKKKFIEDTLLTPPLKKNLLYVGQMME
jgi:hypothetical protein